MLKTYHFTALAVLILTTLTGVSLKNFTQKNCLPTWDADAGLIVPYTAGAKISATSNQSEAAHVIDDNLSTAWQSEAPLPEAFIKRHGQNIFLKQGAGLIQCPACDDAERMMDGDLATASTIHVTGKGGITIDLGRNHAIFSISLKCQAREPVVVKYVDEKGQPVSLGTYAVADNFQLKRWEIPGGKATFLTLESTVNFEVFEIAALSGLPMESVTIDFGEMRPVGAVYSRHWAGENAAAATKIYLSPDGQNWTEAASPDPLALQLFIAEISPEIPARFLKIEHTLLARDWNKVFVWEVKAYDRNGHYGPRPPAEIGHTKIRELLGVNGYWSWGTDQYSDLLAPDGGPYRYRPLASHARNYHDMTWDIDAPGDAIDFSKMAAGKGTPAKEWLNWDREYKAWNAAGLNVQASLQFYRFAPELWKNPRQDGYNYAKAFTRHFGPKNGNGYVCSVEAGNEPWAYPAKVYREILLGMAEGVQAGDPGVEVFPCALQAADPSAEWQGIFKNYMGARITPQAATLLDGINIHAYSYVTNRKGRRQAVQPEHPQSSFWEILNAVRWRDRNMPGKKIYLSEWGWDCGGGGEDCTHDECVSEHAAAVYAVRAALIAARLGLHRATWFYYANDKSGSSLYTRSGLTGSGNAGFRKKQVFNALESLVRRVGDRKFHSVVREDETAWMYLLCDENGEISHLAAWLPGDGDTSATKTVKWLTKFTPGKAVLLDGHSTEMAIDKENGAILLELSSTPLLVNLK
jgi:hypothetical protein